MALLTIRQFRLHAGAAGFPAAVKLMRARPDQISEHHRLMCANLTFGAQINEISFTTERLQHCNPGSDARLFEIMSKQCREALARRQAQLPLELRVRHEIHLRLASGEVSLSAISSHLGMSERSLQRQMQDLGTGFERLLDETRQELCVQLFADQGMKLEAIANALGFASQASFTRAAKRWFGIPPGQARSRSRGDTLA
jgi:AraC-like DNA-binding protein